MEKNMEYYKVERALEMMALGKLDIMPITYKDGAWIYEKTGKLMLALNAIKEN